MDAAQFIPLAGLEEMVKVWLPIIFVVLYTIAQLVGSVQQEKRKAVTHKKLQPAEPKDLRNIPAGPAGPAAPGAPRKQPTLEETLRREVEEFLRRAQGHAPEQPKPRPPRPAERPAQPQPAQPRVLQRSASGEATPRDRFGEVRPNPQPQLTAAAASQAAAAPGPPSRAAIGAPLVPTVAARVAEDLRGSLALGQHASQLGAEVGLADEKLEQHLREKFEHQVGVLAPKTSNERQQVAAASLAQELRNLLSRPGSARQMIIASEILKRPPDRWQ